MASVCVIYAYYIQIMFIGYSSSSNTELWHTAWPLLLITTRVDIQYLRLLIKYRVQKLKKEYTYIRHLTSKQKNCSR